jgi:choline dehydrogenase-like flavoprotein
MIIDARQLNESGNVRGDIAIIGGGAAGISLALELAGRFKDVLIFESGATSSEIETQSLYDGKCVGHDQPSLQASRVRFLGGSTNHWMGQCAPLDPVDFEALPDRPYSGWPFDLAALEPFYECAYRYCEINTIEKEPPKGDPVIGRLLEGSESRCTNFRYSPPTRFGERFRSKLNYSDRIKLYLNANVTDIIATENKGAISSLHVRTLNGRKITVIATTFVLCCGGIENARILLNCTGDFANGVGNQHDLVGRFFMDHLFATVGVIVPQREIYDFGPLQLRHDSATPTLGVLMNSSEIVRQPGRRGCSLFMRPCYNCYEADTAEKRAVQSPAGMAFHEIMQYARRGAVPPDVSEKGCSALSEPMAVARVLYHSLRTRLLSEQAIIVNVEGEQSPNPASRVTLNSEVDALGMRRVTLDWQIDPLDCNNLYQTTLEFGRSVGAVGLGRMFIKLERGNELAEISTCWHHMGTTRMHDDPRQGVVDRRCAVHGLSNLYVAGSSIFPTGGRVNPTVTIVALAIRLADHLKATMKQS